MLKLAQPWRLCAVLVISIASPLLTKAQSAEQPATARVERIAVRGTSAEIPVGASLATPEAVEIEVQTSGPATPPDAEVITAPDRILLDFPGALPSSDLKNLQIHRGAVKSIRAGLFFRNPPITRIVIDLSTPQSYQIVTTASAPDRTLYVIKISANHSDKAPSKSPSNSAIANANQVNAATAARTSKMAKATSGAAKINPALKTGPSTAPNAPGAAKLLDASIASSAPITTPHAESAATTTVAANNVIAPETDEQQPPPVAAPVAPPKPVLVVTFENGMLGIHCDQSTLAEVLYEVQRQTQADIAIPAGAEQEKVVADIAPASAREVLQTLLNGSPYNFIFVGSEEKIERVILTPRDGSPQ